jgi:uncharacterized protein YdcH (DUF465 family)
MATQNAKRRNTDKDDLDDPMSRGELMDMLGDLNSKIQADRDSLSSSTSEALTKMSMQFETTSKNAQAQFVGLITKLDAKQSKRFSDIETNSAALDERISRLEQASRTSSSTIATLQVAVAAAETCEPIAHVVDQADFQRAADPTIIRCRCAEPTTLAMVTAAMEPILVAAAVLDNIKITGPLLGKFFTIKNSAGSDALGAQRIRKILQVQKDSDAFRDLNVHLPGGTTVKMYLDFDKNRHQIRTEVLTKKLAKIIAEQDSTLELRKRLRDGLVCVGWEPLARVKVVSQNEHKIEWNAECLSKTAVSRTNADAALRTAFADAADNVSWG